MVKSWNVYRYTKSKGGNNKFSLDFLGTVQADGHPFAWKEAAKRWPDWAKASKEYPSARLLLRLEENDPFKKKKE